MKKNTFKKISVAVCFIGLFGLSIGGIAWAAQESRTGALDDLKDRIIEGGRGLLDDDEDQGKPELRNEERNELLKGENNSFNDDEEERERIREQNRLTLEAFKQEMDQKREEFKNRIEETRENIKTEIEQKREELKQRLERIKDERKKEVVEKIDGNMDELNERLLKHYSSVLEKLGEVLVRIAERTDSAEERGVDVSTVRAAIAEANESIAAARAAIEVQAEKTYSIQITGEEALKIDVGKTRQALHNDLSKTRNVVKLAHETVRDAAIALAFEMGESISTPTPTPTTTPQE